MMEKIKTKGVFSMGKKICMIGHRGYSARHHENTAEAFIAAARHGSGGVETDVRTTADGVLVLSHGGSVVLEDGRELPVESSTYAQLSAKPLKNKVCNEKSYICTLRRYLEICRDHKMICFIELKGDFSEDKIIEAFEMAREVYDLSKCMLQSFQMENLIRAHELFPELQIMLTWGKDRGDYSRCFDYGFDIDASYWSANRKLLRDFHSCGLRVGLWTANTVRTLLFCRHSSFTLHHSPVSILPLPFTRVHSPVSLHPSLSILKPIPCAPDCGYVLGGGGVVF